MSLAELWDGKIRLGTLEAEPRCGEDFCDSCGDCIYCYGDEDSCPDRGWHRWVVERGDLEEFVGMHPEARTRNAVVGSLLEAGIRGPSNE